MNDLILFLRDISRQKYESFVVFKDTASLDTSNLGVTELDIANGFFWDKQWELNQDLNNLSVGFPMLGIERDTRRLTSEKEVEDKVWIVLAISANQSPTDADDPTHRYLYDELTKILLTIQEADSVQISSVSYLLHPTQYRSQPHKVLTFAPYLQEEPVEIFVTDVGNNKIRAVSAAISVKRCVSGLGSLTLLPPLVTDILPITQCC